MGSIDHRLRAKREARSVLSGLLLSSFVFMAVVIIATLGEPQPSAASTNVQSDTQAKKRASEVLNESRHATGLQNLNTFYASGKSRRIIRYFSVQSPTRVVEKEKILSGKVRMDFALPDKFRLQIKGSTLGGFGFSFEDVINGEQAWRNPPMKVRSFNRDQRVIDVGDIERTLLMQARTARQQIVFYSIGWLLTSPSCYQLDLTYEGIFPVEGVEYDAILSESPDGLRAMLLFDRKTRVLSQLAVSFIDAHHDAVVVEVASVDRRFVAGTYARAREERRRRTLPPQRQEVIWRYFDHRPVDGILIPHRATIHFNGLLIEETVIDKVRVNQPIDAKTFAGKEEVRY